MEIEQYQNLVIGSGEPGKYIAWTLAKQGQKTAVVERGAIGGACPNVACLPSKNVIYSARAAWIIAPFFIVPWLLIPLFVVGHHLPLFLRSSPQSTS